MMLFNGHVSTRTLAWDWCGCAGGMGGVTSFLRVAATLRIASAMPMWN